MADDLERSAELIAAAESERFATLQLTAQVLASVPQLRALLENTDAATIRDVLQDNLQHADLLIVLAPTGQTLARSDAPSPLDLRDVQARWIRSAARRATPDWRHHHPGRRLSRGGGSGRRRRHRVRIPPRRGAGGRRVRAAAAQRDRRRHRGGVAGSVARLDDSAGAAAVEDRGRMAGCRARSDQPAADRDRRGGVRRQHAAGRRGRDHLRHAAIARPRAGALPADPGRPAGARRRGGRDRARRQRVACPHRDRAGGTAGGRNRAGCRRQLRFPARCPHRGRARRPGGFVQHHDARVARARGHAEVRLALDHGDDPSRRRGPRRANAAG